MTDLRYLTRLNSNHDRSPISCVFNITSQYCGTGWINELIELAGPARQTSYQAERRVRLLVGCA